MFSEPSPRCGHFSAAVEGELVVWGGRTDIIFSREKRALASTVYRFNPVQESWSERKCSGPTPPGLYDGVCASSGHHGYACGGNYGAEVCSLHQLDVRSMTWELLSNDGPPRKTGCRMIAYGKTLLIFGGYGRPSSPAQPGAQWERELKCTNELHTFEVEEGEGVPLCCVGVSKLGHSCTQNHASCQQSSVPHGFNCLSWK